MLDKPAPGIISKKYIDVLRKRRSDTFLFGKRLFLGEFKYFLLTLTGTTLGTIAVIVFAAIAVDLPDP
jgi:hypothetical protein